jgi:hypothetical protein
VSNIRISPHPISASTYRLVDKASELADHPPIRRRLRRLGRHHVQYAHHDGAPERATLFVGLARSLDEQFPRSPLVHAMITRTAEVPRRGRDRYLPAFADQLSEYLAVDVPASALRAPRADE